MPEASSGNLSQPRQLLGARVLGKLKTRALCQQQHPQVLWAPWGHLPAADARCTEAHAAGVRGTAAAASLSLLICRVGLMVVTAAEVRRIRQANAYQAPSPTWGH